MGTVLDMNGGALKEPEEETAERHQRASYYADDRTASYLLARLDEHGKQSYFIRVSMTGLRWRVFGPYRTKSHAIMAFDGLLEAVLDAFCSLANEDEIQEHCNQARMMIEPPADLVPVCHSPI